MPAWILWFLILSLVSAECNNKPKYYIINYGVTSHLKSSNNTVFKMAHDLYYTMAIKTSSLKREGGGYYYCLFVVKDRAKKNKNKFYYKFVFRLEWPKQSPHDKLGHGKRMDVPQGGNREEPFHRSVQSRVRSRSFVSAGLPSPCPIGGSCRPAAHAKCTQWLGVRNSVFYAQSASTVTLRWEWLRVGPPKWGTCYLTFSQPRRLG